MLTDMFFVSCAAAIIFLFGLLAFFVKCYRKVNQGTALIRNGFGGAKVSFTGAMVLPVLHKSQMMDISVKRVEISRQGVDGLICKDNMRADIKVAFFVRVNKSEKDVLCVAEMIGVERASQIVALEELFDSKFSEALKTVGKQFEFVDLYNARAEFKEQILEMIGTDLNGYTLEDASIDYLEQTPIEFLKSDNILDSQGIKKITELTAEEQIKANLIQREKEKTLKKQDVEAREAILEMEKQLAETEERQKKEIANIKSRENAEQAIVANQEKQKSEQSRIVMEEEVQIAEQNKERQVIVARKNKERTEAVETERVEKDRMLEATEREKIVTLAQIEKEKALEEEKKNIQDVIRERVVVEKSVVEEEERIKDTKELAEAERKKNVAITEAESLAQEEVIKKTKAAQAAKEVAQLKADEELYTTVKMSEANRKAADLDAEQRIIEAESLLTATEKKAAAKIELAKAVKEEAAAEGLAEVAVQEAKADAMEKQGLVEAEIMEKKFLAEAEGLTKKALAMKQLDGVGREHEEFKFRLNKEVEVQIADIQARKDIADAQAKIISDALKHARIDIVGGETQFFDKITSAITQGKSTDRMLENSETLTDIKNTFFSGSDPEYFKQQLRGFIDKFGLSSEEWKNLTMSSLLSKLAFKADGGPGADVLQNMLKMVNSTGMANQLAGNFLNNSGL